MFNDLHIRISNLFKYLSYVLFNVISFKLIVITTLSDARWRGLADASSSTAPPWSISSSGRVPDTPTIATKNANYKIKQKKNTT